MPSTPNPNSTSAPSEPPAGRAPLKIYLGYASHTGKTWRLLDEARRRQARGQDVVIGWLRGKDRPSLENVTRGLEIIPAAEIDGQPEMNTEAILARKPHVVFIDELAHTNVPGSRNPHRWQDVETLLNAGIGVVTALNIQYIEGTQRQMRELLGRGREETVPDKIVRDADEVVLVDATKETVMQAPQTPAERAQLNPRELLQLRELALLYAADTVEEDVLEYKHEHHIEAMWETQERILACVMPNARGAHILERAHAVASRWKADLWAIYVTSDPTLRDLSKDEAALIKKYLEDARNRGARVEIVEDSDASHGIIKFARTHDITQIFLGHAVGYPYRGALSRTVAGRIIHQAEGIDVHLVADERRAAPRGTGQSRASGAYALARLLGDAPRPENRGHLRIYLGYATGVGKTYSMLQDGEYLRDHGHEVVVGWCDPHGRDDVRERMRALERVPTPDGECGPDIEAILQRRPQIVLIDGLAHSCTSGKQVWEATQKLLDAGIHVFTTLDVSEIESLRDTVECITKMPVGTTVPDWVVEEADELIFVDVATRALLNRVKRGAVFAEGEVPESLHEMFTEGCLNALREIAMRLTAERVEDELEALDEVEHESVDGVLVCLDDRLSSAALVRRGRRIADRLECPCYAVFVITDEHWTGVTPEARAVVEKHLELARQLHLKTHVLQGSNIARTISDFAIRNGVTHIVMGRSRKTGWREFFRRSVIEQVARFCPWTDLQVIADR